MIKGKLIFLQTICQTFLFLIYFAKIELPNVKTKYI